MWVVKLDGALAHDKTLRDWVDELSTFGGGRVIIVPGKWYGSGFIGCMKERWKLADLDAHNMLVLTRAQYGMLIRSLSPLLTPVLSANDVRQVLQRSGVALWMPLGLLREAPDELTLPDVSSDSIAAWLARHLNAERLILVKTRPFFRHADIAQHVRDGVLDGGFMKFAQSLACPVNLLHKSELSQFHSMLLNGGCADTLSDAATPLRS